jgi:hypothetical protein
MQKTRNLERRGARAIAVTWQPTRTRSTSVGEPIPNTGRDAIAAATDSDRRIIANSWRGKAASVRSARSNARSASIIVIRPDRCAVFFAANATSASDTTTMTRVFCWRRPHTWRHRVSVARSWLAAQPRRQKSRKNCAGSWSWRCPLQFHCAAASPMTKGHLMDRGSAPGFGGPIGGSRRGQNGASKRRANALVAPQRRAQKRSLRVERARNRAYGPSVAS